MVVLHSHKEKIGGFIHTKVSSDAKEEIPCKLNHSLQTQQIASSISLNSLRIGCWDSRRVIIISLGHLLYCQYRQIDLCAIEWLPRTRKCILLSFTHPTIPLMLFKMRSFLASFQIFPTRVFQEVKVNSLFSSVSSRH